MSFAIDGLRRPGLLWFRTPGRAQLILISRFVLGVYVVLVVISCFAAQASYYDDPIPLVQGRMVAEGHTPHVDFWSFYPPLAYYLMATAFSVFGYTILAQRLLQAVLYIAFLVLAHRFFRRRFANMPIVVEGATFLVAVAIGPHFLLPAFVGFSISLFALFAYFSAYGAGAAQLRLRFAAAGILAALALTCRFNFGAYAVASITLDFLLGRWLRSPEAGAERVRPWSAFAVFSLCLLISWIGVYLCMCGPHLGAALQQSILFPQREMTGSRFIPLQFDTGLALIIAFPCLWFCFRLMVGSDRIPIKTVVPVALACVVLVMARLRAANPTVSLDVTVAELALVLALHIFVYRLEDAEIGLLLFFACFLHYYLSRADDWHWPLSLAVVSLMAPYLTLSLPGRTQNFGVEHIRPGNLLALLAASVLVIWCIPGFRPTQTINGIRLIARGNLFARISDSQRLLDPARPPEPWLPIYSDSNELKALRFLRVRSSPSDPVFVGVDDHSRAYAVDVRAYWLLDRPIGTDYYIFDTDLTAQRVIQEQMIADLEKNHVHWVILEHNPPMDDSFRQRKSFGSKLLDQYLAGNFSEVARFGRYGVLNKIGT